MNLLNKLTIKNLKLNKKRTVVTIIGIMLSVALITAVASIYSSGIKSLINFETHEKGDFHVSFMDISKSELETLKNNRSIDTLNLVKNIGFAKIDSKNEYKPYAYIKAFTKSSLNNLSVKLVSGRLPENENEILIPTHLKTSGRLTFKVGDTITLDVGKRTDSEGYELAQSNPYNDEEEFSEKIIDTQTKNYKIVGIIERPASNIESYSAPGFTFITYQDENIIDGNMDVYVKYTKNGTKNAYKVTAGILGVDKKLFVKAYKDGNLSEKDSLKLADEMDKAHDFTFNNYLIGLETNPIKASGVGGLGAVVTVVMLIIVFTSVFCIRNSFDISITEKIKQYGMLRSIGATKKQIKKNVFYEASILGIIGIPLGILLGFIASYLLIIISNYYLTGMLITSLKLEFSFSIIAVVVAVILGIITIYLSAFKSARKASHISPIDSIRNSAGVKINSKKIKSPKIIKKAFGMGGEISYKNLKRNKRKYRTTVISIIVSVCIFIALSSFMNMAFDTVREQLKISEYNISLYIRNYEEKNYEKYERTTTFDNIDDSSIIRTTGFYFKGAKYNKAYLDFIDLTPDKNEKDYINIYTLGKEQYKKYIKSLALNYDDIKGKGILYDNSKISTQDEKSKKTVSKNIRIYDYKIGDTISGDIEDENPVDIEIGFVTDKAPYGLKNIDGTKLIVSDEYFNSISNSRVLEIVYKSRSASKLQDQLEEYLKSEESYSINNIEENVKIMNNLYTLVGIFLYGFIIVISLIGITNIFNTITTNMELRKQEFAMLKSVGMTKKEFNRMIRLESLFMGVKSLLFGIPMGIVLSYIIYHFLSGETGTSYRLPIMAILIAIFAVFILISLIMKYSMNKINKQNTIETIRNENI